MDLETLAFFGPIVFSPFIGSFLAVLVDRLPRGEDVIRRPSACRNCKRYLAVRDLLPVVSFVATAGRCRFCKATLPPWLLYVELAAIGLATLAISLAETVTEAWLISGFFWLLMALAVCDLIWFRLPDLLTGALLLLALGLSFALPYPGPMLSLWGAVIGAGSFFILRVGYKWLRGREGLGLGDVKLMAGLGAALGPFDLPLMLLVAALGALAAAIVGRLRHPSALNLSRPLPFGASLAAATGLIWVLVHLPY